MPLSDLLHALDEDAERELSAALAEQQRQADQIRTEARTRAADLVDEAVHAALDRSHAEAEMVRSDARAASRQQLERAVSTALAQLFEAAAARLADLPGTEAGTAATRRLLAEAVDALPGATWARVHAADADTVRSEHPHLRVIEDLGGVGAVVGDDAGRSIDNSARTRLDNLWPDQRAAVAQRWRA